MSDIHPFACLPCNTQGKPKELKLKQFIDEIPDESGEVGVANLSKSLQKTSPIHSSMSAAVRKARDISNQVHGQGTYLLRRVAWYGA